MAQEPDAGVSISKRISCVLIFVGETLMKNVSRHPGFEPLFLLTGLGRKCGVHCSQSAHCYLLYLYEHGERELIRESLSPKMFCNFV